MKPEKQKPVVFLWTVFQKNGAACGNGSTEPEGGRLGERSKQSQYTLISIILQV